LYLSKKRPKMPKKAKEAKNKFKVDEKIVD
jgi:hypothetical protein